MGEVFGTPQYMAPERISSIDAGPSADLYSLGVILFEMLTGQLPWRADSVPDWFVKHMKEAPPAPRSLDASIPEALDKLILDLLAKRAEKRPVDAHRVHADLIRIAGGVGLSSLPEPESVQSQLTQARTLPPAAIDAWARRTALFDEMLNTAYPAGAPAKLSQQLTEVKTLVKEIGVLRSRSLDEQRALQSVEQRGRDARQSLNHAVDALGVDASKARDASRAALAAHTALKAQVDLVRARAAKAQKEILLWEGRSAQSEPYTELSEAYRNAAGAVDKWYAVRQQEKQAEARVQQAREAVNDLQFQIQQLRSALAQNEERTDRDARSKQEAVAELGQRADELETKLMELASLFCGPLRARPELRMLFRELEANAAA
jgi:serine/threonine-protein kinase